MKQYLFKITTTYNHKNKLYEAFAAHVQKLDSTLITGEETLRAFTRALYKKLDHLHQKHPRCKPLELKEIKEYYSQDPNAETIAFAVEGSWTASLFIARRYVELQDNFLQYYIPATNETIKKPINQSTSNQQPINQ